MTDKQIIIKRIRDCDNCKFRPETSKVCSDYENCYMVSEYIVNLREQLRTKEQECERLKKQYNCYACDTCKGKEDYINLKRHCENAIKSLHNKQAEFDQLKAEIERLKQFENDANDILKKQLDLFDKKEQTLTEIKPILEFYANSKIGEKQGNGTYKILLNGGCILNYDTKPAIEALKKISEVLDE